MGAIYGEKKTLNALISDYLAADSSPDASADALAIINIGLLSSMSDLYFTPLFSSVCNNVNIDTAGVSERHLLPLP